MLQHTDFARRVLARSLERLLGWLRSRRTLVAEILSLQVVLTACAGAFAIAGLYWSAHSLLVENVDRWALQWVDELQELGAPLYLDDPVYAFIDVERFANRYPELVRVTWFDAAGETINTIDSRESARPPANLSREVVADLDKRIGSERAHLMHRGDTSGAFIIQSVLWTERFSGDGLLGLDSDPGKTETQTIGFLELELDFSAHFEQLTASVRLASIILVCVVIALVLVSNRILTPFAAQSFETPGSHQTSRRG